MVKDVGERKHLQCYDSQAFGESELGSSLPPSQLGSGKIVSSEGRPCWIGEGKEE